MLKNVAWFGGLVLLPLSVFALLVTLIQPAQAQGAPPHIVIGTAKANGWPVPAGTTIIAWAGEQQIGSATTAADGHFTLLMSQASGVIRFTVNGIIAHETIPYWEESARQGSGTDRFILTTGSPNFIATTQDPGLPAQYAITFTATADYATGSDNLIIELEDFGFPSSISPSSISIQPEGSVAANPQGITIDLEKLNISLPDFNPSTSAIDADADQINSGESVTVTIRESAGITTPTEGGEYQAVISGPGSDVTTSALTILRVINLNLSEGGRGTFVQATGKGFKNGTSLSFFLDTNWNGQLSPNEIILCQAAEVAHDDTGSCNFTVTSPPFTVGQNYIGAVDGRGQNASIIQRYDQKFALTASIRSITPTTVTAGQTLIVHMVDVADGDVARKAILSGGTSAPFAYEIYPGLDERPANANAIKVFTERNYHFAVPPHIKGGIYNLEIELSRGQLDNYQSITVIGAAPTPTPTPTPAPTPSPTPTPTPRPTATPAPAPTAASPQLPGGGEPPHIFTGTATLNGRSASPGISIDAYDGSRRIGATVTQANGRFSIHVHRSSGPITFQVNNQPAAETWTSWQQGQITTAFNLNASGTGDSDSDPNQVFAGLPDLVRAFAFDNATKQWSFFDPVAADVSTLTRFVPQNIYWILVFRTTSLMLNGVEQQLSCVDDDCWNLIVW